MGSGPRVGYPVAMTRRRTSPKHDRSEPRGWFSIFIANGGWFALIAAVILLALTLFSVVNYATARSFAAYGTPIQAEVTRKWIDTDTDGGDDYMLRFEYRVDGVTYGGNKDVGRSLHDRVEIGDLREVWYLPRTPKRFEYYQGESRDNARALQIAAGVAGLVALGVMWFVGRRVNRAVLARRWGYETVGTVINLVEHKDSGRLTGKGHMVWRTPEGIRGESMTHPMTKLRSIGVGGEINVFVRKGHSVWEGDVGPREVAGSAVPPVSRGD